MQKRITAVLFGVALLVTGTSFGAEVEQLFDAAHHGMWHCTAYPEGHPHSHGYSARDEHQSHARSKAINRCERATGHHCHHVDCHYENHNN